MSSLKKRLISRVLNTKRYDKIVIHKLSPDELENISKKLISIINYPEGFIENVKGCLCQYLTIHVNFNPIFVRHKVLFLHSGPILLDK